MQREPLSEGFGLLITATNGEPITAVDPVELRSALAESGVLLLRGFGGLGLDAFARFTERFEVPIAIHNSGAHVPFAERDQKTRRVSSGNAAIELHAEMASMPTRPDYLWFYCLRPAVHEGETTLCDGARLAAELSSSARAALDARRLRYAPVGDGIVPAAQWREVIGIHDPVEAKAALDALFTRVLTPEERFDFSFDSDGNMTNVVYIAPALVKSPLNQRLAYANAIRGPYATFPTFEDGSPLPPELLAEVNGIGERLTVDVRWQPGDIVMIDNWRTMHGRRRFEGAREIAHRMGGRRCAFGL